MFELKAEHQRAFRDRALSDSREKIAKNLFVALPEAPATFSQSEMEELVDIAFDRAAVHGLRTEMAVYAYALTMLVHRPSFESDPASRWFLDVLREEDLDEEQKQSLIRARLSMELGRVV